VCKRLNKIECKPIKLKITDAPSMLSSSVSEILSSAPDPLFSVAG